LAHASPIIDDFDTISEGVHRFSGVDAKEVRHLMRAAAWRRGNNRVERCSLAQGEFGEGCRHFAEPLTRLLGDAKDLAPDVAFLINFLDEPSVLVGAKESQHSSAVSPWVDMSHSPISGAVREACELRSNSSGTDAGIELEKIQTYGLPFVRDVKASKDLCQHPEYAMAHGFLLSPATFKRMPTEVPLLSQAAPYPFSDILYPSTHYGLESSLYKESQDRSWDRKKNAVYWSGSSTGGYWAADSDSWRHAHRQRLAALGLHKEEGNFTYLDSDGAAIQPYRADSFDSALFDVSMTKIVGCEDVCCGEQKRYFGLPRRKHSETRPFRYRFVFDVDGNSYSGRFYRFLASRSVPLKMSIFREWHDERLVPWLHYIPVSQSLGEVPELMRFLATTAEGQRISRRIAEAGREWYFRALTPVHQGIYLYRLMLELAWLQDDARVAG